MSSPTHTLRSSHDVEQSLSLHIREALKKLDDALKREEPLLTVAGASGELPSTLSTYREKRAETEVWVFLLDEWRELRTPFAQEWETTVWFDLPDERGEPRTLFAQEWEKLLSPPLETSAEDLMSDLICVLEEEQLEDGFTHPAEGCLRNALAADRASVVEWLASKVFDEGDGSLAAALIKCAGRLEPHEIEGWGIELAELALRHSELEVRDEAVCALELWATDEAVALLREHEDSAPWLQDYIDQVLSELT